MLAIILPNQPEAQGAPRTMKKILLSCGVLALAGTLTYAVNAVTTQQVHEQNDHHKMIQKMVGNYEGEVWMPGPDGSKQTTKAWESVAAHGKFFTKSEFKMDMGPMGHYLGHGVHGFDTKKGKFVGTWIGSMDPYLSVMEGTYDEKSGILTMNWDGYNMMGESAKMSYDMKITDDGYSMTFKENGKESWGMNMKRSKQAMEASADKGSDADADAGKEAGKGSDADH